MAAAVVSAQALAQTVLLSLSLFVAHDILRPLFGSSVTQPTSSTVSSSFLILAFLSPYGEIDSALITVSIFSLLPPALHVLSRWATRLGDPTAAAILSLLPLLPVSFTVSSSWKRLVAIFFPQPNLTLKSLSGIAVAFVTLKLQHSWAFLPFNSVFNPSALLLLLSWLPLSFSVSQHSKQQTRPLQGRKRPKTKPKKYIVPLVCSFVSLVSPPIRPLTLPYEHPGGLLRILSSVPSVTGRIVVGEELKHGLRYLRADHSILGGVWVGPRRVRQTDPAFEPTLDASGAPLGDSIYSAFVLQEAARLQRRAKPAQNALMM